MRQHRIPVAAALAATLCACGRGEGDDAPRGASAPLRSTATERVISFTEVTSAWGVDFVHEQGATEFKHLPETMGAGAALIDFDGDGDLDLYCVQSGPMRLGGEAPGEFREPSSGLVPNRLFRNDGTVAAPAFVDITAASGAAADTGYGMGVAAGDVDGDGNVDLYVTNLGPDKLLLGDGTGAFRDATERAGLGDARWTSGAALFDADGDGDLDLYVCAYVQVHLAEPQWCGAREPGWRSYCHPDHYASLPDRFYRNRGDGTFEERTNEAGLGTSTGKGLGVQPIDFDGDGDLDLYIANDSTENMLWQNDGDGNFDDATLLSGTGVDHAGRTEAGMGLAGGDYDGDGDLDLFVTNFDDESNTLYRNDGDGLFRDATVAAGLEGPSRLPVGFGTVLEDFDLDGDLDLAVANGHIIDNIELYHDGKSYRQRAQLFVNDGRGRYDERKDAGAFTDGEWVGRGLYAGDLDGDGDADLVLTQCGDRLRILRNDLEGPSCLRVRGLPRGAYLVATTSDGRQFVRESGLQVSYFGVGPAELLLPDLPWRSVSVRPVGASAQSFDAPFGETLMLRPTKSGGPLERTAPQ